MPAGRRFEIFTKRTRNDPGTNRRGSNEELIVAEIGQVGTQFDIVQPSDDRRKHVQLLHDR